MSETEANANATVAEKTTLDPENPKHRAAWAKAHIEKNGTMSTGDLQKLVKEKFGKGIPPKLLGVVFGTSSKAKSANAGTRKPRKTADVTTATASESDSGEAVSAVNEVENPVLDLTGQIEASTACKILEFLQGGGKRSSYEMTFGSNGKITMRRS